jgi:hypothetical protein
MYVSCRKMPVHVKDTLSDISITSQVVSANLSSTEVVRATAIGLRHTSYVKIPAMPKIL